MKRSQEDAEVIIRLDYKDDVAHIMVNQWLEQERRFSKLFGNPDEVGQFFSRWRAIPLADISKMTRAPFHKLSAEPLAMLPAGFPLDAAAIEVENRRWREQGTFWLAGTAERAVCA